MKGFVLICLTIRLSFYTILNDGCCFGCKEEEDEQPLHESPTTAERRPVVTQPSPNYTDSSQQEISKLKDEVEELESKNNELLARLSAVVRANLTDENRQTKLTEQFLELYDNEWTDAFEKLTKAAEVNKTDQGANQLLLDVLTTIFSRCHSNAKDDLQTLTKALAAFNGVDVQSKEVLKILKDDRKKNFSSVIKTLANEIQYSLKDKITYQDASLMRTFIEKCTSICWSTAIQDLD